MAEACPHQSSPEVFHLIDEKGIMHLWRRDPVEYDGLLLPGMSKDLFGIDTTAGERSAAMLLGGVEG
jgi:hypothetical protein